MADLRLLQLLGRVDDRLALRRWNWQVGGKLRLLTVAVAAAAFKACLVGRDLEMLLEMELLLGVCGHTA